MRPRRKRPPTLSPAGLDPYVHEHTLGTPWPSLGELMDRGERLVVFAEVEGPPPGWYHQALENIQETPYRFEGSADFTCTPNRGDPDASLFLLNHWVPSATPPTAPMPSTSTVSTPSSTALAAHATRARIAAQLHRRQLLRHRRPRRGRRDAQRRRVTTLKTRRPGAEDRRLWTAPAGYLMILVVRLLISGVIYLIANAVGLLVAAGVLDDMSIDGSTFMTAVLIFTAVEVLIQPLLTQIAVSNAGALVGSSALIATLVGLIVTEWLSDGLTIDGALTWVLATVIVWAAALLAGLILPVFLLKTRSNEQYAMNTFR